jgi:hypothetical protein
VAIVGEVEFVEALTELHRGAAVVLHVLHQLDR